MIKGKKFKARSCVMPKIRRKDIMSIEAKGHWQPTDSNLFQFIVSTVAYLRAQLFVQPILEVNLKRDINWLEVNHRKIISRSRPIHSSTTVLRSRLRMQQIREYNHWKSLVIESDKLKQESAKVNELLYKWRRKKKNHAEREYDSHKHFSYFRNYLFSMVQRNIDPGECGNARHRRWERRRYEIVQVRKSKFMISKVSDF